MHAQFFPILLEQFPFKKNIFGNLLVIQYIINKNILKYVYRMDILLIIFSKFSVLMFYKRKTKIEIFQQKFSGLSIIEM